MKKIILLLVIAAAAGYGILSYHFILFDDNVKVLKKANIQYENTFVDARGMKKMELATKPDLVAAGIDEVMMQFEESTKK